MEISYTGSNKYTYRNVSDGRKKHIEDELKKIHSLFAFEFDSPETRRRIDEMVEGVKNSFRQEDREGILKEILKND